MRLEQWLACFHSNLSAEQALAVFHRGKTNKAKRLPRRLLDYMNHPQRGELWEDIQRDLAWAEVAGNHLVSYDSNQYPPLLRKVRDAPCILFVLGEPTVLRFPSVAVVGPRKPSSEGVHNARIFSAALILRGLGITSGLAEGIDGIAHKSALDNNDGRTLAVIGTGADLIYPRTHRLLNERLIRSGRGAVISIFRRGTKPLPGNFPRRNRIISGISLATLVIEAGLRSGAMITARLAGEQGRELFAIPGSIHAPLSRGCNKLIKDGALLMENVQDLIEQLAPMYESYTVALNNPNHDPEKGQEPTQTDEQLWDEIAAAAPRNENKKMKKHPPPITQESDSSQVEQVNRSDLSDAAYQLLNKLNYHPAHPDELAQQHKLDASQLDGLLTELELLGLISLENGLYRRTPVQGGVSGGASGKVSGGCSDRPIISAGAGTDE